jgi:hypothetical protein
VHLFLAVLLPLAVLLVGLGLLFTDKLGRALIVAGTVLAGVDVVLVLIGRSA